MIKNRGVLIIFLLFISSLNLSSYQEMKKENIHVKVLLDKTVYYHEEPIKLFFTVSNAGNESIPIKLSDYNFLNYYIEVFTPRNVSVKEKDSFFSFQFNTIGKLKKETNLDPHFRNMQLAPKQILGLQQDLLKFFELKPGTYYIRGKFYPITSFFNSKRVIKTPFLKVIIKEGRDREREKVKEMHRQKMQFKRIITPQDSIKGFFNGKLTKNWNLFFYVIDLRRLIKQFPVFYKTFKRVSDQDKNQVVQDFKTFLKGFNTDEKIISYDIIETIVRKKQAISKVVVKTKFREFIIKREYRIGLILKDHWYIYGYSVMQR